MAMSENQGQVMCRMLYAFSVGDEEQTRIDDPEVVKLVKNKKRKAVQALIKADEYNLAIILFVRSIIGWDGWDDLAPHVRRFSKEWAATDTDISDHEQSFVRRAVFRDIKRAFRVVMETF